ncbi:MAG: hypothetical protein IMW99_10755 [Firmicutes bacterium]|nr:hypothetical protein [Bacillota bacterium]
MATQEEVARLQSTLNQINQQLRQALRDTSRMLNGEPRQNQVIGKTWEEFIGEFFGSVKRESDLSGKNLMGLISLPSLLRRLP